MIEVMYTFNYNEIQGYFDPIFVSFILSLCSAVNSLGL